MTTTAPPTATHKTVALAKIATHPKNPRRDLGDVTDLAASITEVGLLQDLVVAPWPAGLDIKKPRGAEYVLIAGHRRHAAAKAAKVKDVPVKIRADLDTLAKQLEAMLVENLHRADLTAVEEADTYQQLLDLEGLTQKALAAHVGQPVSRIRERLKLARLEQPVKEKVHTGQLTIGDAVAIGTFASDEETTERLLKQVGTPNFRHALTMAERGREIAAELEKKLKPYRDAGVTIVDHNTYALPKGWKSAGEILGRDYVPEDEQVQWDATEHATCPGRVVLNTGGGTVRFGCSEGKLHPKPKREKSEAEVARANEDRARREAFAPGSLAATQVRRAHIANCLAINAAHAREHRAALAREHLETSLLQDERWWDDREKSKRLQLLAPLLSLGLDRNEDVATQTDRVRAALAKLTLDALVVLHWIVKDHGPAEERLADIPKDGAWYGYDSTDRWIRTLVSAFGYEFADWERDAFDVNKALAGDVVEDDEPDFDVETGEVAS